MEQNKKFKQLLTAQIAFLANVQNFQQVNFSL